MVDELSPAEEARLRRLLARSRHDERVPEDVASRLDDVLARLEAEDPIDEPLADVHELAARRRRTVVSLLVAAAAVVVVGIGLGQVVGTPGSGGEATTTAESAAEAQADSAEGRTDGDEAAGGVAGDSAEDAPEADALSSMESGSAYLSDGTAVQKALGDLLVVRGRLASVPEERFSRSALRLQRQVAPQPTSVRSGEETVPLSMADRRVQRAWSSCSPIDIGEGTGVAVLYDGEPAVLVFRPPMGETQVAELLQCGTGALVRSVTLPAG